MPLDCVAHGTFVGRRLPTSHPTPARRQEAQVSATLLDGKAIAKEIQTEIAQELERVPGPRPCLAAVLVGEDPASQVYVRNKERACERVGMRSRLIRLPVTTGTEELLTLINQLNDDAEVHGILVQLPLPQQIDAVTILDAISPAKDVDAFHPHNVGLLSQGRPRFLPCTPHGVIQILARSGITLAGKRAVILGRSDIVGKPLGLMMVQRDGPCGPEFANATVTLCHSRTPDLANVCREADILVAAIGQAEFVTGAMIKPGAAVIDVGINRIGDRLVGDVHLEQARAIAGAVTPVPGGVGPLTVTMLLHNTLMAAR